jgi:hypothetical protein
MKKIKRMNKRAAGRPRAYPWPVLADGSARRLVRGEDFDSARSFESSARSHARRNNLRVSVAVLDGGNVVEVQFFPSPGKDVK